MAMATTAATATTPARQQALGQASSASAWGRMIATAWEAGCPADQVKRLLSAGIVLQPRQWLASAAARAADKPGAPTDILYGGARGGGKSYWSLAQIVDDCLRYDGLKVLFLRKVGKSARESFEDLRRSVLRHVQHDYNRHEGIVTFDNDSRILLGHFNRESDIDAYLGIEYDVIVVEEATTLSSAKISDIRTCCRTSKPGWRPRMYYTTNPGGVSHQYFRQRFVDPHRLGRETDTRFIPATVDDNAFINVEYRATLDTLTGWKLRAWRWGDWDIAAGQFFTNFMRDVHVIAPTKLPANWQAWGALDYGFTHYTAFYVLTKDNDGNIYVAGEHAERRWLPQRHAESIRALAGRTVGYLERLDKIVAGADVFSKRSDGKTVAEQYQEAGIKLSEANDDRINGAAEILQLLGDAQSTPAIPPKLFIFNTCARLIECLPSLQHDPHRPEDVLKVDTDDDGVGGDDFYDALRYGVMASQQTPAGFAAGYVGTNTQPGRQGAPGGARRR